MNNLRAIKALHCLKVKIYKLSGIGLQNFFLTVLYIAALFVMAT